MKKSLIINFQREPRKVCWPVKGQQKDQSMIPISGCSSKIEVLQGRLEALFSIFHGGTGHWPPLL